MKHTASNLLAIARAEIGYREKASNANLDSKTAPNDGDGNYTKYGRDLYAAGYYNGNKNGYAWCDQFADWCVYQLCGKDAKAAQAMQYQSGPLGAGCVYSAKYYQSAGHYGKDPKVGAQIFFGNFDHTGLVESIDAVYVTTIEGNKDNQVSRCKYRRNDPYITGYGYPNFEPEDKPAAPAKPQEETVYIVKLGDTLSGIAAKYGTTYQALAAYNGLSNPNLIHVGQQIRIPGTAASSKTWRKGDKVRVVKGAKTYTGGGLASWVYSTTFGVIQADDDRVVIGINGAVTAAVHAADLTEA